MCFPTSNFVCIFQQIDSIHHILSYTTHPHSMYKFILYIIYYPIQIDSIHHILSYTTHPHSMYKLILYIIYYPIQIHSIHHILSYTTHPHSLYTHTHTCKVPMCVSTFNVSSILRFNAVCATYATCQTKYIPMKSLSSEIHTHEKHVKQNTYV